MADQPINHGVSSGASDASAEDIVLKAALEDVPLPAGLASRLKTHIRAQYEVPLTDRAASAPTSSAAQSTELIGDRSLSSQGEESPLTAPSPAGELVPASIAAESIGGSDQESSGLWLRRSILMAVLAAGIGGFAFLARQWTRPAEPSWLAAQCDLVMVQIEQDNPANWQPASQPIPAALARVQSQLARVAIVAQRPLADLGSKMSGTVYRLDAGDGRGIYLMQFDSLPAIRGLTSRFEALHTPSGGWSLVAMTAGKETFVLAAACTERQIFAYIRRAELT